MGAIFTLDARGGVRSRPGLIALVLTLSSITLAQGSTSIVFNGTSQGAQAVLPDTPPYSALTIGRLETHISNFSLRASQRQYVAAFAGGILLYIQENTDNLAVTDFQEAGSPTNVISLSGRSDILIRFQKVSGSKAQLEIWNSDGTGYAVSGSYAVSSGTRSWSGEFDIGYSNPA